MGHLNSNSLNLGHNQDNPNSQILENQLTMLQGLLDKQADVYSKVEEQMIEKQMVLIEGDPEKLSNVDQGLMGLSQQLTRLEDERIELLITMGYGDKSLKEVIQELPPKRSGNLRTIRNRLLKLIQNVQVENDKTQALLNLSIQWVEGTVELIANALVPEAGSYNAQGSKNNRVIQEATGPLAPSTIQREA